MSAVGLIPARYHASRFPGKLLARVGDRSVIEHVLANASAARRLARVIVVCDDDRIAGAVRAAGGEVFTSRREHISGSDRIGEAVQALGLGEHAVVNVQGDEPLLPAAAIDTCVQALDDDVDAHIATLATPCDPDEVSDHDAVKVVCRGDGRALYFSRSAIPSAGPCLKHIGIYAFRAGVLQRFTSLPPGRLETAERLEQLRALEAGFNIRVSVGSYTSIGIDTPADLAIAAEAWSEATREGKG